MDTQLLRNRPAYTLDRETAPAMWLVGTLWLIPGTGIQTSNRSAFLEQLMPRGLCPPTHRHPLSIEGFCVVEGVVSFHMDDRTVRAEAGNAHPLATHVPCRNWTRKMARATQRVRWGRIIFQYETIILSTARPISPIPADNLLRNLVGRDSNKGESLRHPRHRRNPIHFSSPVMARTVVIAL